MEEGTSDDVYSQAAETVEEEGKLKAAAQEIILRGMAASTRRSYDRYVASFKAFCADRPPDAEVLKDWMVHLYTVDNQRANSIKAALSLVRKHLEVEEGFVIASWRPIYQLLKGMQKG